MITDEQVYEESKYMDEFYHAVSAVMAYLRGNFMKYAKPPEYRGYEHKFYPKDIMKAFDEQMMKYGFEIDARTLKHAHGIGNNNEWDIVDKDINKVGEFYATNNMYHGVILGVCVNGKRIDSFEIHSDGFTRG